MEIAKEIIENNKYVINTDASFDNLKKIGTYSVIIQKNNKVIKSIARKFKVQMKNSLECEIFAVYIAISIILTSYIGKNKKQEFRLSSDCQSAVDYFKSSNNKIKAFENNDEIAVTIKNTYKTASQRIKQKGGILSLLWIPREKNKVAHKCTYNAFKQLKNHDDSKDIILIDKNALFELILKNDKNVYLIIKLLFEISNEQKMIIKTQKEMANILDIPISTVNKNIKKLVNMNVLQKVKKGKYLLLI